MKKTLLLLTFFLLAFNGFSQADLKVVNSDYKSYYTPGATNTYTITVINLGPLDATNVKVSNSIPSGVLNFSWTGPNGKSGLNSAINDNVATLPAGQMLTYIVTLKVPNNFGGSLKNETIVTSSTPDPNPDCDQCADVDTIGGADIVITNTDNKLYYTPGTSSVYTVTVTNKGPLDAANVRVHNVIPTGITKFSWTGTNASAGYDVPLNNVIPLLKNGETVTYTITLDVPADYTGNLTSQTTELSDTPDPNPGCADCIDTNTILSGADIVVTNTDNKSTYTAGTTNTYAVTVENKGPDNASGVSVTNSLPAGINPSDVTWKVGNGSVNSGFLNDNIGTLAVGQIVTYTVTVKVPSSFVGNLNNKVSATSSVTSDPFPISNQLVDTDTQDNATDIVVVNTDNTDIYTSVAGSSTVYTVTVTNNGPIAATNVKVKEVFSTGINASNVSWKLGSGVSNPGFLNDNIATLAVGQTVTYTVTLNTTGFSGDLTSEVLMTSDTVDSSPVCDQCKDTDRVTAGVVVVNTDSQPVYTAGRTATYIVTVTNHDAVPATNVAIQDAVPAGIDPTSMTWKGDNGTSGTGPLTDKINTLAPNQTVTYTVSVKVPSNFDQKANLTSEVKYTVNGLPNSSVCTQCKDVDAPSPSADLQIVKTDNQDQFYYNSSNTYSIVIANNGPSDANNVVVQDKIPLGISNMSWLGSNGTRGSGELNDVVANLPVGQVVTYMVTIDIPQSINVPGSNGNLVNTVAVNSDTPDSTPFCPKCSDSDTPRTDYVTVDVNKFTANQLVTDVLVNSPCVNISNFSSSKSCGFGYFNKNNSNFPIKEGMVIRCGNAASTQGKFNNTDTGTTCSGTTDDDLQAINCKNGNCDPIKDASFVKFDFVAGSDKFSFNYLFASNEYGVYQCGFSDAFAFILTDVTKGVTPNPKNLAIVPGKTVPVSVTNIRQSVYNPACPDNNPTWFGQYNAPSSMGSGPGSVGDPSKSAINMVGQTVLLTASSDVIPGHTYSIKLVIGDYRDAAFDSAVFIEAGSFKIGEPKIETPDGVIDNLKLCEGSSHVLRSGTTKLPFITYTWKLNGVVIPGEDNYFITITKPGTYTVTYTYAISGCEQSDDFTVGLADIPALQEPTDLYVCQGDGNTFDLSKNVPVVLGMNNPDDYDINYFTSQADAASNANPIGDYTAYSWADQTIKEQSIYMTLKYYGAPSCVPIKTFKVHLTPPATGTIQYVGGASGLCRNSNAALAVTKSATFTEGGMYSVSPNTGLTLNAETGILDLTNSTPGDYVVNYKVPANLGCLEYNTTTTVKVKACPTVVMNPIDAICPGSAVSLTCSDAGTGIVYTWSDASGVLGTTTVPAYTVTTGPAVAGNYTYTVVASYGTEKSAPSSQTLVVNPIPTVSVTSTESVCVGRPAVVTFSGTSGAFVTYNDGTGDTKIQLSTGAIGTYVLNTANLSANATYKLVTVAATTTPSCLQNIASTAPNSMATIAVIDAPTASVSFGSAKSVCMGEATDVVFDGTPGAVVSYTKNGVPESVTLSASGQKIISTGILNEDTLYNIESVTSAAAECVGYPASSITVDVVVIPYPGMKQKGFICIDPTTGETTRTFKLDTALDSNQYTFTWYYQEDGQAEVVLDSNLNYYDCDKVGQYKVVVTDNGPLHCQRTAIATVSQSVAPLGVVAEVVTDYFENNATVVANAAPKGTYEYSLDYGPFQDSNTFQNVGYGQHTVHARDKEACADVTSTVTVVDFPRYFTPNADGYNDDWNISVLSDQPNSKIYIFDRFGKLLKQISPVGTGWDGTYNGHPMPADDYWFVVKYDEQLNNKEFKAHFSLKR